jgi:hypothetical protein
MWSSPSGKFKSVLGEESGVYSPPSFSSSASSTPRDGSSVSITDLAFRAIQELEKLNSSERSNADDNKDNDRKEVLCERLALYCSARVDDDYYEKLHKKIQPIIIELQREDYYLQLRVKVIRAAILFLQGSETLHKENALQLVQSILKEIIPENNASIDTLINNVFSGYDQSFLDLQFQKEESQDLLTGETLHAKLFKVIVDLVLNEIVLAYQQTIQDRIKQDDYGREHENYVKDLENYLKLMVSDDTFINLLANKKPDDLEKLIEVEKEELCAVRNALNSEGFELADLQEQRLQNRRNIFRHSSVKDDPKFSNKKTSELEYYPLNIFKKNKNGRTVLDKAVQLGRETVIADLLNCAILTNSQPTFDFEKTYRNNDRLVCINFDSPDRPGDKQSFLFKQDIDRIAELMLGKANDYDLIFFIKKVGNPEWPHNDPNQLKRIDEELRKRYIDKDQKMPDEVWQALKERQQKHRHFEKLAHVYEDAIIHVINKSNKKLKHYADKATSLLQQISDAVESPGTLAKQAEDIGNDLVQTNHKIAARGCSIFALSKTQRLVENARDKVIASPELCQTLEHDVSPAKANVTKSEINAILVSLKGDEKDQKVRRQRAALARAAFKKTLQYLEKQCNKEKPDQRILQKKEIVEGLIASYSIDIHDFKEKCKVLFDEPSDSETTLMSKRKVFCCCSSRFWAKSAKLLYQDLKASKNILSTYLGPNIQ